MMSNYDKKKIAIVEKSSEILAILAGVFLCVSTIFMFANMLTRTVADFNIRFVYELCGLCAAGRRLSLSLMPLSNRLIHRWI